ncbi:MAG: Asp23/Gls24 family envelope stress response protein [Clostridia bacterium]|nr:Asp23/Gls24 family envelope stress response protein [Clostridia bacterium]
MSNFKLTSNDKKSGKIVYSKSILGDIIANAVAEVEGTVPHHLGRKSGISFFVEKDGVYVDVSVAVRYGYNVPELAYRVQQSVKQSIENMTNFKVAEVDVHVLDVVFDGALPVDPADKEEQEEGEEEEEELTEENN